PIAGRCSVSTGASAASAAPAVPAAYAAPAAPAVPAASAAPAAPAASAASAAPAAPAASAAPLRLLIDREPREPTANFEYRPRLVKVDRVSGDGYEADASRNEVDLVSVRSRDCAASRSRPGNSGPPRLVVSLY